jgi:hypothetical protein
MKRITLSTIFICAAAAALISAERAATVALMRGDVRVRRGLEETWSPAASGIPLEPLDTVWSGEASEVTLRLEDGTRFTMGANAMLDVGDLRRITERQMFLFLMSRKVGRLPAADASEPIRIANVSVVRGSDAKLEAASPEAGPSGGWILEKNGASALASAGMTTNAVVRLVRILERYPSMRDGGEVHWMLGRAFETLKEPGRAADAYRTALDRIETASEPAKTSGERADRIRAALDRLKEQPVTTINP